MFFVAGFPSGYAHNTQQYPGGYGAAAAQGAAAHQRYSYDTYTAAGKRIQVPGLCYSTCTLGYYYAFIETYIRN